MAKDKQTENTWSRPGEVPRLIARKQVDWSIFEDGSHIALNAREHFAEANSGALPAKGEAVSATLVINQSDYSARMYVSPINELQITYGRQSAPARLFRDVFRHSYDILLRKREAERATGKTKVFVSVDPADAEYIEFYATGRPYRYEVKLVPFAGAWSPPTFEEIWVELRTIIGDGLTVNTLGDGVENGLRWTASDAIEVSTNRSSQPLPRRMFEEAWSILAERRIVVTKDLPGEGQFRSAAIMAILALLPLVDYSSEPRITLFLKGHRFPEAQLAEVFELGADGDVRWPLHPKNPRVAFVFHDGKNGWWDGDELDLTIAGPNQAAIVKVLEGSLRQPLILYGFKRHESGGCEYLGRLTVDQISNDTPPRLILRRLETSTPGRRSWIFQANPKTYNLEQAAASLSELTWTVSQHVAEIKAGDEVFLWISGKRAGVVGMATVLTNPTMLVANEAERPYFLNQEKFAGEQVRVRARIDLKLRGPISRQELQENPLLAEISILKFPVGTNFPLTTAEATELRRIAEGRIKEAPEVAATEQPAGSFTSLQLVLEYIMERGATALHPGQGNNDDPLKRAFLTLEDQLKVASPVLTCPTLIVEASLARGRVAAVPWAAIMDRRITTNTKEGLYLAYLFRQDMTGVYLVAMLGVTNLSTNDKERVLLAAQKAAEVRPMFSPLTKAGFVMGEEPDLHADKGDKFPAYQAGTIAHKFYAHGSVPDDDSLLQDLRVLLGTYDNYIRVTKPHDTPSIIRIAPAVNEEAWAKWLAQGYAGVPWGFMLKEVTSYGSPSEMAEILLKEEPEFEARPETAHRRAAELWLLRYAQPGTTIVATRGTSEVLAVGKVVEGCSRGRGMDDCPHTLRVDWDTTRAKRVPRHPEWGNAMITEVPFGEQEELLAPGSGVAPRRDLEAVYSAFRVALKASNLAFADNLVRSFIASLATKHFAILTGISGSGKTQLALRMGDWFGRDRSRIIAVRPDWTGAEALFGFEDALQPAVDGSRPWQVPEALQFMLQAASDPCNPYLLILDEMNLAHVERYFADVLSGMESGEPVLPNLFHDKRDGTWRRRPGQATYIPVPDNLFIVGTVNVDETTYMFSPKVLDRANTFEFVVDGAELRTDAVKPLRCDPGPDDLVAGFLSIACDDGWHIRQPPKNVEEFAAHMRSAHSVVQAGGFGFAHRVFYEAIRYFAMLSATGQQVVLKALDLQIMQKVLPRLHGNRRKLEPTLAALGQFCFDLKVDATSPAVGDVVFDFDKHSKEKAVLHRSYEKLQRMMRSVRVNGFAGFTE